MRNIDTTGLESSWAYIANAAIRARDLIAADDLTAMLSTDIHFLEVLRNPLFVASREIDERHLTEERVGRLIERIRSEEKRFLEAAPGFGTYGAEHLNVLRAVCERLEAIIKQIDESHLTDCRLSESIELLDALIRNLRRTHCELKASSYADLQKIDLRAAICSLVRFHELGVEKNRIVFETDVRTDKIVLLDQRRFNSILDNLLLNSTQSVKQALETSKREAGLITTGACEKTTDQGEFLEIAVEDNGLGIREEDQRPLLERPSITASGTGLGLWTVARIARWYAGKLTIRSKIGHGTCVTVALNMGMIPEIARG